MNLVKVDIQTINAIINMAIVVMVTNLFLVHVEIIIIIINIKNRIKKKKLNKDIVCYN